MRAVSNGLTNMESTAQYLVIKDDVALEISEQTLVWMGGTPLGAGHVRQSGGIAIVVQSTQQRVERQMPAARKVINLS